MVRFVGAQTCVGQAGILFSAQSWNASFQKRVRGFAIMVLLTLIHPREDGTICT